MGRFTHGNKLGKGRKAGSKNAINKDSLIDLINACADDLNTNFDKLSTNQKIKVLTAFKEVYRNTLTDDQVNVNISYDWDKLFK